MLMKLRSSPHVSTLELRGDQAAASAMTMVGAAALTMTDATPLADVPVPLFYRFEADHLLVITPPSQLGSGWASHHLAIV
jgi:hypothetical protein